MDPSPPPASLFVQSGAATTPILPRCCRHPRRRGRQPTPPGNSEDDLLAPAPVAGFGLGPLIDEYLSSLKGLIVAVARGGDAAVVQHRPPPSAAVAWQGAAVASSDLHSPAPGNNAYPPAHTPRLWQLRRRRRRRQRQLATADGGRGGQRRRWQRGGSGVIVGLCGVGLFVVCVS